MITMTALQFADVLDAQQLPPRHQAFVCPCCHVVQSADDLIRAGAGQTMSDVEQHVGFSCVGRWQNDSHPDGKRGCDLTLAGLEHRYELEVMRDDYFAHPHFMPASAKAARAHMQTKAIFGTASMLDGLPVEEMSDFDESVYEEFA